MDLTAHYAWHYDARRDPDGIEALTRRTVELESLAAFDEHLARTSRLHGWFVRALDLTERAAALGRVNPRGAVFLGCTFAPGEAARLSAAGALIFPSLPALPFEPYRSTLYDPDELYGTGGYAASPDARIYGWARSAGRQPSVADQLGATLHDHAISDALDDVTAGYAPRLLVGVMGGHGLVRGDPAYRGAVDLGGALAAAGRLVLTGGGPGAMEAANLGAYLSPWPGAAPAAVEILARAPSYSPAIGEWLRAARQVRDRWPATQAGTSLSVPTWFYGHEPSNLFARWIAKFFANALREDTLLHRCRGGIAFLPGAAGTVQEIFQAATEDYYAADTTLLAPLVLVGVDYWTRVLPAWPLLEALSAAHPMANAVRCVDTVAEAAALLIAWPGPAAPTPRPGSQASSAS